jgi:hypothetical protein
MRTILVILLALLAGFLAGLVLSEVIGIAGVLFFARPLGIKYLPVYLAVLFAGVAFVVDRFLRRRSS